MKSMMTMMSVIIKFFLLTVLLYSCKGADGGYAPSTSGTTLPSVTTPVVISPAAVTLAVLNSQTFTASGGAAPYTYTIFSGSGTVALTTGVFKAPSAAGTAVVRVKDAAGQTADAVVTIKAALQISPTSKSLTVNAPFTFSATGGVPPLKFTIASGSGVIDQTTGAYTAPATPGNMTIRVTDAKGNTSNASVSVFAALGISPATYELAVNNTTTFTAAGGSSPYTFSVQAGVGSINASTGVYTAPSSTAGGTTATVRVTDSLGAFSDAFITVHPALAISPTSQVVLTGTTVNFTGSGGVTPYTFSLVSGTGSVNPTTGDYTAPLANGSDVIQVTDDVGNTATATITITSPLSMSPSSKTLAVNNAATFSGSGGTPPYTYSLVSGVGSINSTTGVYTAPASSGTATVRVTDSLNYTANASITINPALTIVPAASSVMVNATLSFTGSGGVPPYTFSLGAGSTGVVNTSTGVYTAPSSNGSATVTVTDSLGNAASASVTVTSPLSLSPSSKSLAVNNTQTFSAVGGTGPFTYSLQSGVGSINASTGVYTAPVSTAGGTTATVKVTDSLGATATASVTVNPALAISPATQTVFVNGTISFSASGGVSPYTYTVDVGGIGTVNAGTGVYTAPNGNGTATVRVTDANNNQASAAVTVTTPLTLSPASKTLAVGNTQTFTASGGTAPLTYSVQSGVGTINASSGVYTAPASTAGGTSATIKVTDSLGATATSTVTVNPALTMTPTSQTVFVNGTISFSASGGVTPYTYSIDAGGVGTVDSSGVYTAPGANGTATVRVTDANNNQVTAAVTVTSPLSLTPASKTLAINNTTTFAAVGGTSPFTYSIVAGGVGSINSSSGLYTAPASTGSATIKVTDSLGATATATVTVNPALAVSPSSQTMGINSTLNLSASGGALPYTYAVFSGTGSVAASTGVYTAPASPGSATVRVTDSAGNTADCAITITSGLSISPASATLAVSNTQSFTAANGATPYTYSIQSGVGTVNASGVYTAPASTAGGTTAIVKVTDNLGATATATVTVNAALAISPSTKTLAVNNAFTFSATGGVTPYTFSVVTAGGGTINSTSGAYTAPASAGTYTIRVTDAKGNISNATVTVNAAIAIAPASQVVLTGGSISYSATGGVSPYTYSVSPATGAGTINSSTGAYTAPGSNGSATVTVTDSLGNTSSGTVTITSPLSISPSSKTLAVNNTVTFSGVGGTSPYTYSLQSGVGSMNASTGVYTAPSSTAGGTTATVKVTDSLGATATGTVTVNAALAIAPASQTVLTNGSISFSATGGVSPYSYAVSPASGAGTINTATGAYTAPGSNGTATVTVTDSLGNSSSSAVTITSPLSLSPATKTLAVNNSASFSAVGGTGPYTYSVQSGVGSMNASTGVYTAPSSTAGGTTATVKVTDSLGATATATVTVNAALAISPASQIVLTNGTISYSATGGVSPYTYGVTGVGTVVASTGVYTAPATTAGGTTATVTVTDSLGNTSNGTITVTTPLSVSPATKTLAVNNTATFSGVGGTPPYSFAVTAGTGTIVASTGVYTAPAASGTATITLTDSLGATATASVTINAALAISPVTGTISSTGSQTYTATGGVSPYTFSILSGPGSIGASTGVYTPSTAGSVSVRVTDAYGNTSDAALTVNGPLSVTPTSAYVVVGSDYSINPVGGVQPYSYAMVTATPATGSVDIVTGVYTAPATPSTATVRVTDSTTPTAATVDITLTSYNALTLSPLTITMAINTQQTFTASGGVGTRTFSMYSGTGSINASTGVYTAPAVAGTDYIQVTDTIGNSVQATIRIVSQLAISPATLKLPVFSTNTFSAVLGSSPYTYSVFAGTGTVNSSTGVYTAPSAAGTGTVRVTDASSNVSDAAVTHIEPVSIASGATHSCVLYNEGSVKCFGLGSSGQLGNGATTNLGDTTSTQGGALPFVNLGTGKTAVEIATGYYHSCARFTDGTVKCWGQNTYGQLGTGNTTSYGSAANQMGDNLPAVNLGTGRTATKLFAFGYVTCVKLDDLSTKCWGRNTSGQLGLGDTVNRGTSASQMGDSLAALNFGTGRTAVTMSGGFDFTCAQLDDGTGKCWGANRYGQLGYDNTTTLTSIPAAAINLGSTIIDISAGYSHACAVLSNNTAKCWGRNNKGQLGLNSTTASWGDAAGNMGALAAIPFTSFSPVKIFAGNQDACAMNASGQMRCWGLNANGQLLVGSTANIGRSNNDMQGLTNINVGTGLTISSFDIGFYTNCAITSNKRIKCWGYAASGAVLNTNTANNLGDVAGEVGDSLPYVNH